MDVFDLQATLSLDKSQYESGLVGAQTQAKSFGTSLKTGLVTGAKVAAGAVVAVGAAVVGTGVAITKATGKVAQYGDNIDKMSQKMGISAKAYQEWDAVLKHSGTSIDALKPSMKTLANAAQSGAEEFQKLGISQEEVASLSQEDLFSRVIAGLQGMEEGTERTAITSKLLGRGATELGALLNQSAEDTEKMKRRVHELGGVMSDEAVKAAAQYQDSLQDLTTSFESVKRNAVSQFLPSMITIMDGLTSIFAGEKGGVGKVKEGIDGIIDTISNTAPKFARTVSKIASALMNAVIENIPAITKNLVKFLVQGIESLVDSIPTLADAGIQILTTLMDTIWQEVPKLFDGFGQTLDTLIPNLVESVLQLLDALAVGLDQNGDKMADSGITLMEHLLTGIVNSVPRIVAYAPKIILSLVSALIKMSMKLQTTGIRLVAALVKGIISNMPKVGSSIMSGLQSALNRAKSINWISVGLNIVSGIIRGVVAKARELASKVKNILKNAYDAGKKALGINSPSKVFERGIGYGIPEGVALGVEKKKGLALDAVKDMEDMLAEPNVSDDFVAYDDDEPELETETMMDVLRSGGGNIVGVNAQPQKNMTVILQLDKMQLARAVFQLNNDETQRVGVQIAGGLA